MDFVFACPGPRELHRDPCFEDPGVRELTEEHILIWLPPLPGKEGRTGDDEEYERDSLVRHDYLHFLELSWIMSRIARRGSRCSHRTRSRRSDSADRLPQAFFPTVALTVSGRS